MMVNVFLLTLVMCFPVYAATKKKITSVSIKIDADDDAEIGKDFTSDSINVESKTKKYSVDSVELLNEFDIEHMDDDDTDSTTKVIPELEITLTAEDNYYFAVAKASDVKISGNTDAKYISGKKKDSSKTLVITVKLKAITRPLGEITKADWNTEMACVAEWENKSNNAHEIQLLRDGKKFGPLTVVPGKEKTMDFSPFMLKAGASYSYRIREYNESVGKRGKWVNCYTNYVLPEDVAARNKDLFGYYKIGGYGWEKDENGWWYSRPGGYYASEWLSSNDNWFYMNEKGYAVTGWNLIDGKWYFFNTDGEMAKNTSIDGYDIDENGVSNRPGDDI